jgi:protein-S-isoprenylcysteine O-methyltransferase Ste14
MKNVRRHLSSFIAPFVMGFVLPLLIVYTENNYNLRPWKTAPTSVRVVGLVIFLAGLSLLIITIRMFILIGNGTIMPWDPTRKLIVAGIYQHVRNPMILSIIMIQVGETIFFTSPGIAVLAVIFFAVNTIYFIFSEEPGLEKRFGQEYIEYKENVPRWIPRWKPWRPG